jgi:hypothetical protein
MADLVEEFGADLRDSQGMTPLAPLPSITTSVVDLRREGADRDLSDVWPLLDARTGKRPRPGVPARAARDRSQPRVRLRATGVQRLRETACAQRRTVS